MTKPATTKIWDLPTRLFHWLLVGTVLGALGTGLVAPASWQPLHVGLGYGVAALVGFRLVWGFAGSRYSRFGGFVFTPRETIAHARSIFRRRPPPHLGHNPAGALMIFALLGLLMLITGTGLAALGGTEKLGPLAGWVFFATGETAAQAHEWLSNGLLMLIGGHLLGVLLESRLTGENLPRAMITGHKRIHDRLDNNVIGRATSPLGTVLLAILLGIAGWAGMATKDAPAKGNLPRDITGSLYATECGDCHHAFHPSLLDSATWDRVMAGLDSHFGEDASLDPETTDLLNQALRDQSAEFFDTKGARAFTGPNATDPLRITNRSKWSKIHEDLNDALFRHARVGSRTNCGGCHQDAATGLFADRSITLPETPQ
ncbi:cytochrome b/b6 domain-containing protein [Magnetospira sp. QH-2]|uniref:cytochrome b/b6 domain-containing protein n=1 Tax=Magnetospira sp. (strain QH-2) TaxID=1288970 RepID=UPI0003E812E7|nr:cytochrome b/b6 domain-containing protein [Magnetospira sp. QH-2]CCQ75060.1 putative cytochrome B561 [Magnetospira sp. QH-2]